MVLDNHVARQWCDRGVDLGTGCALCEDCPTRNAWALDEYAGDQRYLRVTAAHRLSANTLERDRPGRSGPPCVLADRRPAPVDGRGRVLWLTARGLAYVGAIKQILT